jgi:DNA-binding NarL/FixJ family response regulator
MTMQPKQEGSVGSESPIAENQHDVQPDNRSDSPRRITGRHLDLLKLMAEGASAKEAGRHLGIAEQTVKNHLHEIYQRLEARNCSHAVALAITAGYVQIETN